MPLVTEIQVAGVEDARRQLIEFFRAFHNLPPIRKLIQALITI